MTGTLLNPQQIVKDEIKYVAYTHGASYLVKK